MATETLQKNKDGKLVIIYTTNPVQQDAYIKASQAKGYIIVKMETIVDAAFLNQMEPKWSDVQFVRVDADIADNLVDKQEHLDSVLSTEEQDQLKTLFDIKASDLHLGVEIKGFILKLLLL